MSKYLKRVLPIMNRDSLDSITSKTKEITVSGENGEQEVVEVPVWNGTVANILLMSLGPRSAPEILLSIVGIVGNEFKQDALGPSLIGRSQQTFSPLCIVVDCSRVWRIQLAHHLCHQRGGDTTRGVAQDRNIRRLRGYYVLLHSGLPLAHCHPRPNLSQQGEVRIRKQYGLANGEAPEWSINFVNFIPHCTKTCSGVWVQHKSCKARLCAG